MNKKAAKKLRRKAAENIKLMGGSIEGYGKEYKRLKKLFKTK